MAFRKKAEFILTHKPDILIIVECEHPDKLLYKGDIQKPTDSLWFGKNQHNGRIPDQAGRQFYAPKSLTSKTCKSL